MLTMVVSYESQRREPVRRVLRIGLSECPFGSPTVELWRSVAIRGSMAWRRSVGRKAAAKRAAGPFRVEGDALGPRRLGLELSTH